MATFDDLEREVSQLRQKVRNLEGGNAPEANAREVSALTGTNDDDRYNLNAREEGGFAAACRKSGAARNELLDRRAISEAQRGAVRSQEALRSFYNRFRSLGRTRCDAIINQYDPR